MNWVIAEAQEWIEKPEIANAFGIVLYTDRHSNIAKVLNEDFYLLGLHERSGQRWPIFVTKRPAGTAQFARPSGSKLGMIVEIWKEPNENLNILRQLELENTKSPYLLIYSLLDSETTVVQTIELYDDTLDKAHSSLKEALDAATRAIEGVNSENIKSAEGVQQALDLTLTDLRQRRAIVKALPLIKILAKLFKQGA